MSPARKKDARTRQRMARAQERMDRAQERMDAEFRRAQDQMDRAQGKVDQAHEEVSAARPLIWMREEPSSRRPTHTRADIAAAAIEIADAEGFDAVSMRRVAQKLGAGTMTLYHYVANKDELITLMFDEVMGEVLVPEEALAGDWRAAIGRIALHSRDAFRNHRWIFDRMGDGRPGPNAMRHFEQSLQAVSGLAIDPQEKFELISLVDDFVFGYALREAQETEEHERGWPPEVLEYLQREMDSGDYPLIRDFLGDDADAGVERVVGHLAKEGRFERGLTRLLDGIEASLPKPS
ncbi:MAG TPA: TetR/AcrR family transcriptional regulator [Solirubrobacterales bacterium]|nr:TetR/AcrR family transcriptional regulator [Solirubrobacterales bacterium]